MKQSEAQQLLSLMAAKTEIEQYAYGDLKRREAALHDLADMLRRQAKICDKSVGEATAASAIKQEAARTTHMMERAKECEQKARDMTPELYAGRKRLEHALQRELAIKKLSAALAKKARKKAEDAEEGQRELLRTVKAALKNKS